MSLAEFFYVLPTGMGVFLALIGMTGRWRRVAGYLVCSYAALVIAAQHSASAARIAARYIDLDRDPLAEGAFAFGGLLVVVFIGLLMLYGIVWRPTQVEKNDKSKKRRLPGRLVGAVLCGLVGWTLGAMLAASGLTLLLGLTEKGILVWTLDPRSDLTGATTGVVVAIIQLWLPRSLPLFLV